MEIRRRTGSRPPPEPVAPIKGAAYLGAQACFECHKSWKRPEGGGRCPQCGATLAEMGRSFRAPRQADAEQWEKVRALWSAGFRFASYRSHPGAEPLPERLRDVADFIRRNPDHPMRVDR